MGEWECVSACAHMSCRPCLSIVFALVVVYSWGGREGGDGREAMRLHLNTEITTMPAPDKRAQRAASHPPSQARPNDPRAQRRYGWGGCVEWWISRFSQHFLFFPDAGMEVPGKDVGLCGKTNVLLESLTFFSYGRVCVETSFWLGGRRAFLETERLCLCYLL